MSVAHDVAHDAGHADEVLNDRGGLDAAPDDLGQILDSDVAVDEAEDQGVENSDSGALGRGEDTAEDTADNDDDHQQAGNAVPQGLEDELCVVLFGADIAALLGHDASDDHAAETPEDAGDVACHEQSRDGNGTGDGGVDDHDVAGRDHHAGRAGGDVADRYVFIGVAVFLLHGSEDAAHCDSRGNAGAGHCAEEHVSDDVGLSQCAGQTVRNELCAADETAGDTAGVHDVAGEHEEGYCQQREGVDALEHLLCGDGEEALVRHDDEQSRGAAETDAQADRETESEGNEDEGDHYDARNGCNCHFCLPPVMRYRRAHRRGYGCHDCSC